MLGFLRTFGRSASSACLCGVTLVSCGGNSGTANLGTPEGGAGSVDPIDQPPATCGSLDAAAVARIAPANLERVLRRASRSLDVTNASLVLPKSLSGKTSSAPWDHQGLDKSIDDLLKSFREHLFVDANVEAQAEGVVTYRLRPATMCGGSSAVAITPAGDAGVARPPSSCEKYFTDHELRLEARRVSCDAGDNLHIDFLADAERHKVFAADWFENRIDLALDVGESIRRLESYGTFADDVVFDKAAGRLAFTIDAPAAGAVTMRFGVPIAIDLQTHNSSYREGVTVARASDAVVMSADPATKHLHVSLAVGSVDATMPLKDFVSSFFNRSSTAEGMDSVTLSVAGLDGDIDYDGAADALSIHHLGLGGATSRVTRDGVTLLAIDFNADADRHADFNVTADPQHQLLIDIAPKAKLDLEYSMASVNPLVKNLEQFALDDTVSIQIDGAHALKLMETAIGTSTLMRGGTGWLVAMTTGGLSMTSRTAPASNIQVAPNKCLYRASGPFQAGHEILRELSARDCP